MWFTKLPLLSILIWWPILVAGLLLAVDKFFTARSVKVCAVTAVLIELFLSVVLYWQFDLTNSAMQFREFDTWIPFFNINYSLGIDGISLVLIILTSLTTAVVVLAGFKLIHHHLAQYLAAFLVSEGMIIGVFSAMDSILFYMFWEGMLIPVYLSIGIWGDRNRSQAAIKFFIYTFLGSVLMLVGLIYLHQQTGSFEIRDFYGLTLSRSTELWLFAAFFVAFAVKVPMWPLHTWLPDAHTEAPAGGSVVLAALMLKLGVYGFVRFSMPIVPIANEIMANFMVVLSLIAIVYVGILALKQADMKKLIAYSSIAHMGFAVLGCYMIYNNSDALMSFEGAVVQMIAHAFSTGGMFLAVGILQHKLGSRQIKDFGGVAKTMPVFSFFFILFALSNIGMPGTAGFVGEFMVIVAAFHSSPWVSFLAATTLVIAASYTLWMFNRVFFGAVVSSKVEALRDISCAEIALFSALAIAIFFIGVYPQALLHVLHVPVGQLLSDSLM